MKILAIGDIVGKKALEYLTQRLWKLRDELKIDFVVANGENSSDIYGMSATDAEAMLSGGVDLITLGNHAFSRRDIFTMLSDSQNIIRPANYPPLAPGAGYTILSANGYRILGINIMGTAFMDSLACPFDTVDKILEREAGNYDFAIMDVHAESTSEKCALGLYFDGRISMIFGTHTHVATADEQILPRGSGYITDIGMVGPKYSVIGADAKTVIERMRTKISCRLPIADGEIAATGIIFDVDTNSKKVKDLKRIKF